MDLLYIENIANVSYNIAKQLRTKGYNVILLTRHNPQAGLLDLASNSKETWIKTFNCNSPVDKTFRYLSNILSYKVDIIHCHYALEQGVYSLFSRMCKRAKKVICHCHGTDIRDVYHSNLFGWIVKFNLQFADRVFVSTPDLLLPKTEFLPNPIDTSLFKPADSTLDLKAGHSYSLFFPSRQVWKHKGQDLFLRALKILIDQGYDCNLVMLEYGPDAEKTKMLVDELHLRKNVCFIPTIHPNDMPSYYNSSDIVWDQIGVGSIGLVSLEAMSCNKPVLADFAYDTIYAEPPPVIRVYNLQDIVIETKNLLDSKKFRLSTRWWIDKYHSYESIINKLTNIYTELLAQ